MRSPTFRLYLKRMMRLATRVLMIVCRLKPIPRALANNANMVKSIAMEERSTIIPTNNRA